MTKTINLSVDQGDTFSQVLTSTNPTDLQSGYSVSARIRKWYGSQSSIPMTAVILTDDTIRVSLTDTETTYLTEGRYVYEVSVTSAGGDETRTHEGQIIVSPSAEIPDAVYQPIPIAQDYATQAIEASQQAAAAAAQAAYSALSASAILFKYDSDITDADPGVGHLRLNNLDFSLVTSAYVSASDIQGNDIVSFLDYMSSSTSVLTKGTLLLRESATAKLAIFRVADVIPEATYYEITLEYVASSPGAFTDENYIGISFNAAGDKSTAAGSDTQVQFRDGTDFGGDNRFFWDKTIGKLSVTGDSIEAGNITSIGWSDVKLRRVSSGILALQNGLTAQEMRWNETYTNDLDQAYARFYYNPSGTTPGWTLTTAAAGTGVLRDLVLTATATRIPGALHVGQGFGTEGLMYMRTGAADSAPGGSMSIVHRSSSDSDYGSFASFTTGYTASTVFGEAVGGATQLAATRGKLLLRSTNADVILGTNGATAKLRISHAASSVDVETGVNFRQFNLGTSASANTEYAQGRWIGNAYQFGTFKTGTGASRAVAFIVGGTQVGAFDTGGALHVQGGESGFSGSEMTLRWDTTNSVGHVQTYSGGLYLNALGNSVLVGPTGMLCTGPLYVGPPAQNATLESDGWNILALRNAGNGQAFRIYKAYTDVSNYANLSAEWNGNEFHLRTRNAGTHSGTASPIGFYPDGSLYLGAGGFVSCWEVDPSGHFLPHGTTNTRDIGSPTRTARRGYFGTDLHVFSNAAGVPNLLIYGPSGDNNWAGGITLRSNDGTTVLTQITNNVNQLVFGVSANVIEQRNAANAQTMRWYETYTDASNYSRGFIRFASNQLQIGSEAAGTGTVRPIYFVSNGSFNFRTSTDSIPKYVIGPARVDLYSTNDGANYERFVKLWEGSEARLKTEAGGTGTARNMSLWAAGNLITLRYGTSGTAQYTFSGGNATNADFTMRPTGALLYSIIRMQGLNGDSAAGLVIQAGQGAGWYGANTHTFRNAGSTQNYLVLNATVATFNTPVRSVPVPFAELPAPATAGSGARAFITDSDKVAFGNFGASAAGGGGTLVPVYSDGVEWRIG